MKDYQNSEQDRRLTELENHWIILNSEMGVIKDSMQMIKTNQEWMMKFFWLIVGTTISTLITSIFVLLFKQ